MSIFDKDLIENEEIINRIKQWEVLFELTRKAQKKQAKEDWISDLLSKSHNEFEHLSEEERYLRDLQEELQGGYI